ncbi:MAG: TetR family transcriptional regulator [Streptosporangiales bacterium]|nr:TetR family transcriptional regulator [Streptosporangiales bacterium]
MPSRTGRAAPLPPDARRAAIIEATLPLVRAHGYAVSTRQIAEAAGVAEGTLFRAFPDKRSLIEAVVVSAFDPRSGVRALQEIDRAAPLEERVTTMVELLRSGMESTWQLFAALRASQPGDVVQSHPPMSRFEAWDVLTAAVAEVFEPDAHRLVVGSNHAARVLGAMVIMASRPFGDEAMHASALPLEEIVDVFLYGLVDRDETRPSHPSSDRSRSC